jgi:UPF0755 protein
MRRIFTFLVVTFFLAAGGVAAWVWYSLKVPYQAFPKEGVFVTVPRGASGRSVGRILAKNGVVRSPLAFEFFSRRHPRRALQAGEYFFDHAATAGQVFDTISSGKIFVKSVTIPEGYTMFDIAQILEQQGLVKREDFLAAARDPSPILDLAPSARNLEGFLFPATYPFPRHPSANDIVGAMAHRFREVWQRLSPVPLEDGRGVEKVVTLASLVERETPVPAERPIVAGVFTNRLRSGVALQCDPTVAYALALKGKYNGMLTGADLRFDSPYNTYQHPGLPPGPIANPGEASLKAALDPARVDYYYFVANTQGGHFFSRTLAEHNANVARYRHMLSSNGHSEEPELEVAQREVEPRDTEPSVTKSEPLPRKSEPAKKAHVVTHHGATAHKSDATKKVRTGTKRASKKIPHSKKHS